MHHPLNAVVADEGDTIPSATGTAAEGGDPFPPLDGGEADDLDALLNLADTDFSRVANVDVTAPSLNVEVTTVSRKKSTVGRSPAAVFVISKEMIRRSGATSVPEVLRMAPGVQVARMSSHQWAVSIRGFNGIYSNKLQVQIDGRSIYTPLFGGVFWSAQNIPLTEIERIEIIRGPGASVWGANAVNGIINIITKRADDTQGLLVQGGTGTMEHGFTTIRYGAELGDELYGRVYGNWFDRNHAVGEAGLDHDNWLFGRTGFRLDYQATYEDKVTFSGDYYDGVVGQANNLPNIAGPPFLELLSGTQQYTGGDLLYRWQHEFSDTSNSALQFYYDRSEFDADFTRPGSGLQSQIDVFDVDFQHQFEAGSGHSIVWGAGFQYVSSDLSSAPGFLEPRQGHRTFERISGFIQDEITLSPDSVYLTVGTKISDNTFTGFEVQPTARLLWLPDDRHSVWAAVSRAVRVPTIAEVDGVITLAPVATTPVAVFPQIIPGDGLAGQNVTSYEVGIRGQPADELSWDLSTFINRYDNLGDGSSLGLAPVPGNPLAFYALQQSGNGGSADSYGAELSSTLTVTPWMNVKGSYSYIQIFGTSNTTSAAPRNQLYLQSSMDLSSTVQGDVIWRYVDTVPDIAQHYNVMDLRLAWRPCDGFEWAFVARNLLDDKHPEFTNSVIGDVGTQIPTEVYSMITWEY